MAQTFRSCVFTEHKEIQKWDLVKDKLRYLAYAQETCPSTGKVHYQGFAYSWKPMRLTGWKKVFPTAHIEAMRGNFRENELYCSKEGNLTEFGEKPNDNGVKTSILAFKRRIDEGETVMDISENPDFFGPYLQNRRGLHEYAQHVRAKKMRTDRTMPEVYIRIGPAGTGKTSWLDEQYGLDGWRPVPANSGQWFDGCDYSDVMLFDDVEAASIPPLSLWKRLTDRYPFQVPVKGGFITWHPKVIVFTSNHNVDTWWPNATPHDMKAVWRRIKRVSLVYKDKPDKVVFENALLSQEESPQHPPLHQAQEGDPSPPPHEPEADGS